MTPLNTPEDLQWLKEVHLLKAPPPHPYDNFKFAILHGNEDTPDSVDLYLSENPNYTDNFYKINFLYGDFHAIGAEMDYKDEAIYETIKILSLIHI